MNGIGQISIVTLAAVLICAAVCAGQTPQITAAPNPHFSADGCGRCHSESAGAVAPIPPQRVTLLCISCHDGAHASAEAHPIGASMIGRTGPDPRWPTPDGIIDCTTCHDVRKQCDASAQPTQDTAAFLRQTQTPSGDPQPFCDNCHSPRQSPKFNPHLMLAADGQTTIQQKCQVCHSRAMDRNSTARSGNSYLRVDQVFLCRSCHPRHRDISRAGHVLTTIRKPMLVYMRARELTGLLTTPSPDLIKQLTDENARPTLMVPDAQERIVCTTCHNPHQQGVFDPNCVLADRSLRLVQGHLFTPTRGQIFCRRCHNF